MSTDVPGSWLRRLPPRVPADLTLICFPHAGGSADYYLPILRPLSGRVGVAVVQYPGRHDRATEPPVPSIRQLARKVVGALGTASAPRLALFGHSMGALVAFETALLLERETGTAPVHLFVSGHKAPSRHHPGQVTRGDDAAIVAGLRELGGTDERVLSHRGLVSYLLPALRTDYAAVMSYRYRAGDVVSCGITALVGDHDPGTSIGDAQAWTAMTSGRFTLRAFPGGHFYLRQHRRLLVSALEQSLSTALPCEDVSVTRPCQ